MRRIFLKSMRDEKRRRTDDCAERHQRILSQREPNDDRQQNRNDGVKPNALPLKKAFAAQTKVLGFEKEPVEKQKHEERAAADK